ncbi:MAG TPA: hypothetical protein VL501_06465 [Pyrinomonadaceae bacterium]|nr:hypothetical protein [Pyrinomonadaceae bacterium]
MAAVSGSTKAIGRVAGLVCTVGVLSFFAGLFIAPRVFAIAGVGLMVLSVALFWIEEMGRRSVHRTSWRS